MKLNKNMGKMDRIVRIVAALAIIVLILTGVVSGWLAIILGVLAAVFVVTSIVSFCPLYLPFHISTKKE
jgi:cytochrome c biogenesis protein ResB